MKKTAILSFLFLMVISFSSCKKDVVDILPGTWNVSEIKNEPPSGSATTLTNAGTVTFESGGTGSYNLNLGIGTTSGAFVWVASDNNSNVTISGFNILAGQYTVITNKTNKQVWQRLDSNGDKYTYTLDK